MRVDAFPAAGTKVQASDFVITVGGQSGNAAIALARLGARTSYAGPLGDQGDAIANESSAASSARASIAGLQSGCRARCRLCRPSCSIRPVRISSRRGAASGLSEAVPADAAAAVEGLDAVLLDNRYATFCLPIGEAAKARGIPRVLDFDQMAPLDDAMLALSTHVIASAEALRSSTGQSELDAALLAARPPLSTVFSPSPTDRMACIGWSNGAVRHMDAFKVDAIDTLGAGDTFHGAFTLRLVESGDVVDAMRFASAAAAIKCTRFGGLMGAATRAEVEAFLRERA